MKYQLKINSKIYPIDRQADGYYCNGVKLLDFASKELQNEDWEHVAIEEGCQFKIGNQYFQASLEKVSDHSGEAKLNTGIIKSPLNGIVYSVDCQINSVVKKGDKVLTIEAMKMLYPFYADKDGIISFCEVTKGSIIKTNQVLITIRS